MTEALIVAQRSERVVIGGPDNSGILAGDTHFDYRNDPAGISAKVARITDIAQRHNIPIKAAAL
jgi:D-threo-aldose 1-dehydrogenase